MGNRFDDLKRLIVRKRDFQSKFKLVKMIRREVHDVHPEAILNSVEVGFLGDKVVAIVETSHSNAIIIRDSLKNSKITKHFDIRFKINENNPIETTNILNKINKM